MSKDIALDPPSYEESIPVGRSLIQQVNSARLQHIQHVVSSRILPLLLQRASRGLSTTTIALLPQELILSNNNQSLPLIGFANTDEDFQEIKLKDDIDTHEFWEQEEALDTLRIVLSSELSTDSRSASTPVSPTTVPLALPPRSGAGRFSFWNRKSSSESTSVSQSRSLSEDDKVAVGTEEVCYRTMNRLGLYETISRKAVIIRVQTK